jgi:hypothetical protein
MLGLSSFACSHKFLAVPFPRFVKLANGVFWKFVSKPLLDEALVPVMLNYHIAPSSPLSTPQCVRVHTGSAIGSLAELLVGRSLADRFSRKSPAYSFRWFIREKYCWMTAKSTVD